MNRITRTFHGLHSPESHDALRNPERGLRFEIAMGNPRHQTPHFIGQTIIPGDPRNMLEQKEYLLERYRTDGITVIQFYVYLSAFFDRDLSDEKLLEIESVFTSARHFGVKLLLRFAYQAVREDPGPTLDRTLSHIRQLGPLLRANSDVIYVLQTGFVGCWGEFHSSAYGIEYHPHEVVKLMECVLENLPPTRFTMMRCARYISSYLHTAGLNEKLNASNAFTSDPVARIGFFNDGTLARDTDGGTFPSSPEGQAEFDLITSKAPFIPVDGELFWLVSKDIFDSRSATVRKAAERFALHHYSTFSYIHNFSELDRNPGTLGTIDFWKKTALTEDEMATWQVSPSRDYFTGITRTGFEYLRDHLGYRLELEEAVWDETAENGTVLHVEVSLFNRGFAAPVNPRPVYFVLSDDKGHYVEHLVECDFQKLQPYTPEDAFRHPLRHYFKAEILLPDGLPSGEYSISVWMPDKDHKIRLDTRYAVRFANLEWCNIDGRLLNLLGRVCLK